MHVAVRFSYRACLCVEHVEFAIGSVFPCSDSTHKPGTPSYSFTPFMQRYTNLTFELSAATKEFNPDVSISIPSCKYIVKFHELPLERVIEMELQMEKEQAGKAAAL